MRIDRIVSNIGKKYIYEKISYTYRILSSAFDLKMNTQMDSSMAITLYFIITIYKK